MNTGRNRSLSRPRGRSLRIESLENRHLLSGLPLAGPGGLLPGLPGSSPGTLALVCDSSGTLWSYNASQGAGATAQQIGSTGTSMRDVAFDGTGVFYGVDAPTPNHGSTSALYQISFNTNPPGNVQAVLKANLHGVSGAELNLNSLAFDTIGGKIWAAGSEGSVNVSYNLYEIDPTTFAVTNQWPLTVASGANAGAYQPAGDVEFNGTTGYVTTTSGKLIQFNPTNPAAMQAVNVLGTNGSPITDIEGLSFGHYSSVNMLLAYRKSSNNVYRLDPNANQWVQFGSVGSQLPSVLGAAAMTASYAALPQPEIAVFGTGQFGLAIKGSPGPRRTFLVVNMGSTPLTTGPITLPDGFVITEPLKSVIPAHGFDTFTVRLVTTTAGTFGGDLLFSNNDADGGDGVENPFHVNLSGKVIDLRRGHGGPKNDSLTLSASGADLALAKLASSAESSSMATEISNADVSRQGPDRDKPSGNRWQGPWAYFDAVYAGG